MFRWCRAARCRCTTERIQTGRDRSTDRPCSTEGGRRPMSEESRFQGAKQAIRTGATQAKQQPQEQNPPPYINQKDAVEVSWCLFSLKKWMYIYVYLGNMSFLGLVH